MKMTDKPCTGDDSVGHVVCICLHYFVQFTEFQITCLFVCLFFIIIAMFRVLLCFSLKSFSSKTEKTSIFSLQRTTRHLLDI